MGTPKKIDIVYLWVDGSDEKWRAEKDNWYKKITGKTMDEFNYFKDFTILSRTRHTEKSTCTFIRKV